MKYKEQLLQIKVATGASNIMCRRALEKSKGNLEEAIELLKLGLVSSLGIIS